MTPFDTCLAALKQPGPTDTLFKAVDKALAEVSALLILRKKVQALWGDEDDDTGRSSAK